MILKRKQKRLVFFLPNFDVGGASESILKLTSFDNCLISITLFGYIFLYFKNFFESKIFNKILEISINFILPNRNLCTKISFALTITVSNRESFSLKELMMRTTGNFLLSTVLYSEANARYL